ncbi:MAG: PAS domain S-box protein [Candidatus Omnitrophica bacterium]|nr:PAS domain S-box protein [Candidatus Omnitrophota bacterium]
MIYLIVSNLIFLTMLLYCLKKHLTCGYRQKAFRRLINNTNIGYYKYRCDDNVILSANEGFLKILELDMNAKDVAGRSLNELLIDITGDEDILDQLRKHKKLKNYEYRFKTLTGKDKCVLHNSYLIKDIYHKRDVVEALIEDVTEERASYDKMRESQERYEKLFKNSGDMVIIFKLNSFDIEEVNPITEVLTGLSPDEITGTSFKDLIHPAGRKSLDEVKQDLLFRGTSRVETVMVCKNGAYKEVIITLSVAPIGEEKIVMAVIKDIHEQAKEREELSKRKKELEDFWKTAVEREERIKELRQELERTKQQVKLLEQKHGIK